MIRNTNYHKCLDNETVCFATVFWHVELLGRESLRSTNQLFDKHY